MEILELAELTLLEPLVALDFFDELPVERLERLFELGDLLGREALPRPVIRVLLETLSLGVDTSDGLLVLVFVADHGGTPSLSLIA